jgi:hypothetical protein
VLLVDSVCTLVNIVIVDFTQVDLVLWATIFCGVVMTIATQAKDDFYDD